MMFSSRAVDFLKEVEGFSETPYQDQACNWTIGYGHKIVDGDSYYPMGPKKKITKAAATTLLKSDMQDKAGNYIDRYVHVELTQNQYDALTSFVYNIGADAFFNSTMLKFLNDKNFIKAAGEFHKWCHIEGHISEGLVCRRSDEKHIFMSE